MSGRNTPTFSHRWENTSAPPMSLKRSNVLLALATILLSACDDRAPLSPQDAPRPAPQTVPTPAPKPRIRVAEKIDDQLYEQGTVAKLTGLTRDAEQATALRHEDLLDSLDASFSKVHDNLNDYLVWYYDLPNHPVDLTTLWYAGLEEGLERRLHTELTKEQPFKDFEKQLALLNETEAVLAVLERKGRDTLRNSRLSLNPGEHLVIGDLHSKTEFAGLLRHPRERFANLRGLRTSAQTPGRIAASIAAHAKIQSAKSPIIQRAPGAARNVGAFKLALETLSMVTGAVAGGVVGSALPGPGTVTGGVAGRLGGKKAADTWGPRLENKVSVKDFRTAIRTPLDNRRKEIRARLAKALEN